MHITKKQLATICGTAIVFFIVGHQLILPMYEDKRLQSIFDSIFGNNAKTTTVADEPTPDDHQGSILNFSVNESRIVDAGMYWVKEELEPGKGVITQSLMPICYSDEGTYKPINTTITPSLSNYAYNVERGLYKAYFKDYPYAKVVNGGTELIIMPDNLNMDTGNDITPSNVTGGVINQIFPTDTTYKALNTFNYPNIFGDNINLTFQYDTTRMKLRLYIYRSNLPPLSVSDKLSLSFKIPNGMNLDFVINNKTWDKKTSVTTDWEVVISDQFKLRRPVVKEKGHWVETINGWDVVQNHARCSYKFYVEDGVVKFDIVVPYSFLRNPKNLEPLEIDPYIDTAITNGQDDAKSDSLAGFDNNDQWYYLGHANLGGYYPGFMFRNISVDNTYNLYDSKFWITITYGATPSCLVKFKIWGVALANPQVWESGVFEPVDGYNSKTENATETIISSSMTPNGLYAWSDIDVTKQVQEIVNVSGFESGNNMSFVFKDSGTSLCRPFPECKGYTYEDGNPNPFLRIYYVAPTVEQWNEVSDNWFSGGHIANNQTVIDMWFSGGNIANNQTVVDMWFSGGNIANNQTVVDMWFSGGHIANNQTVVDMWFSGGNTTVSVWNEVYDNWFSGGHIANNQTVVDMWFSGGNLTSMEEIISMWFSGNNVTEDKQVSDNWFSGGSSSGDFIVIDGYFRGGNLSQLPRPKEQIWKKVLPYSPALAIPYLFGKSGVVKMLRGTKYAYKRKPTRLRRKK